MNDILKRLTDKNDRAAYEYAKQIASESAGSDRYYNCLNDFASLLTDESSYVRTRGFVLCCSQARWDRDGRIKAILPEMMPLLNDRKPTVVRQCLKALTEVAMYLPELNDELKKEISGINLTGYKDSMAPLIKRDMDEVMKWIDGEDPQRRDD